MKVTFKVSQPCKVTVSTDKDGNLVVTIEPLI
ncbi:MAG: hypothetical protein QOF02_3811 [Blastocatellia bacterium]|jgi:hypothetical protein|nr:hypothetical protein [Blastocatellia bacterium]